MLGPGQDALRRLLAEVVPSTDPAASRTTTSLRRSRARRLRKSKPCTKRMGWKFAGSPLPLRIQLRLQRLLVARANHFESALSITGALPEWAADIEDLSGDSVFYKDRAGQIFHTSPRSVWRRKEFLGIYRFLDPRQRAQRNGPYHSLPIGRSPEHMPGKGGEVTDAFINQLALVSPTNQRPLGGIS
jgi:hypothetical protein